MKVRIDVDDDAMMRELDALIHADVRALHGLESVLANQYTATQAEVHVVTGSLKGSGDLDSDLAGGRWTGTITYGGSSPGRVNDPVKYAWYEQRRSGAHDFMAPARAHEGDYETVIEQALDGRR